MQPVGVCGIFCFVFYFVILKLKKVETKKTSKKNFSPEKKKALLQKLEERLQDTRELLEHAENDLKKFESIGSQYLDRGDIQKQKYARSRSSFYSKEVTQLEGRIRSIENGSYVPEEKPQRASTVVKKAPPVHTSNVQRSLPPVNEKQSFSSW